MQMLMFTKMLQGMTRPQMASAIKELGLDGLDLTLRAGFPVHPDNVKEAFPEAVRVCADHGLVIGMVTTEGDWTSADVPGIETALEAMVQSGCRLIKPGYWQFKQGQDYWNGVAEVKKDLDGLARLAEKHGVTWLIHTHSGPFFGTTCGSLHHLIGQFDPKLVAAYIDPGHLALNGEPLPMAISMVRDRLRAVAVKNLCLTPAYVPGGRWQRLVVPLDRGFVDWGEAMKLLGQAGFDGPLSLHSEYHLAHDEVLAWTAADLRYLRSVMGG